MKHLIAAGGVVYRNQKGKEQNTGKPEVLLIFRKGVWDLPKGKLEDGEAIPDCAAREVSEEVGSSMPIIQAPLNETFHEYKEGGEQIGKKTQWFAMSFENPQEKLTPEVEEDIQKISWVPLEKAIKEVGYKNLVDVLHAFKRWHVQRDDG